MSDRMPVAVRISGCQKDAGGEESRTDTKASGYSYFKGGRQYVLYEDMNLIEGQKVASLLKVACDGMTLLRKEPVNQRLEFLPGRETRCLYRTPYGNMELGIETKSLKVDCGEQRSRITVVYELSLNGQWQSSNELCIDIISHALH